MDTHVVLGGEEAQQDQEVGFQRVVQRPDEVEGVVHHHVARNQTT